jgi:hypothetical protein
MRISFHRREPHFQDCIYKRICSVNRNVKVQLMGDNLLFHEKMDR